MSDLTPYRIWVAGPIYGVSKSLRKFQIEHGPFNPFFSYTLIRRRAHEDFNLGAVEGM